jgi:hypothetical protein
MLQHPWILPRTDSGADVKNYYFSRVRDRFEFEFFELPRQADESSGDFVTLSLSSNKNKTVVKVLDHHVTCEENLHMAAYLALDQARRAAADRLEYPATLHDFFLNHLGVTSILKRKKRLYLYFPGEAGSPLASAAEKIRLDYCDSDIPFT